MQTPRVFSYVRFSTLEQRKGTGQQRQEELAEKWCRQHGYTLVKNYSDLGVSAFKGKNATEGALAEFRCCVEDGRVPKGSILLVESLDRLSRQQVSKAAELFLSIVNNGITVVTLADGAEYTPDRIDFAQLVMSLGIFLRANDESRMKSQRKAASWKIKREGAKKDAAPLGAKTPRWIRMVKGRYELIEEEAEKVRSIFRDYTQGGMGLYLLHKKHGVPKATIAYWLHNPVVLGTVTIREDDGSISELPNHYPAVIEPSIWKAAQRARKERFIERRRTGRQGFVNLFAGMLLDPKGKRFDVSRHYGFSSYVSHGMVLQCQPFELAIITKLAHKFVKIEYVDEVVRNPRITKIEEDMAVIKAEIASGSGIAAELLPVLRGLRAHHEKEVEAATIRREKVDVSLIGSLATADHGDQASRLALREIVKDTIRMIRVIRVEDAGIWFKLVFAEIEMTNGETVAVRFAYCTRRLGIIMCDGGRGYKAQTLSGFAVERPFNTEEITPALLEELKRLPLRHPKQAA